MALTQVFFSLSEGVVQDARGLLTAVAMEPMTWVVSNLPEQIAPWLVLVAEEATVDSATFAVGDTLGIAIGALDPSGAVLARWEDKSVVQPKNDETLPRRLQVVTAVPILVQAAGDFKLFIEVAHATDTLRYEKTLRIRLPSGVASVDAAPAPPGTSN